MTTKPYPIRESLALPGLRPLWTAQLVSIAGDFLALIAVLSIATFRLHATPAQTTGVTIAYMLPLALCGPLAGVLVDRRNPRRVMIASDLVRALLAFLLVFATRLSEIYAILFAISSVSVFFLPAQSILVRTLVPRDALLSVNAVLQQAMLVIRMLSPALAGALVARFGPASCFYLDALSFCISALMLWSISLAPRPQLCARATTSRTILADLSAGIGFILTHQSIGFVLFAMAAATFAISCFSPLIAIFVRDVLHANVRTFGVISTMTGVGMIAGTQLVRRCAKRLPPRKMVRLSLGVIAGGIVVIATSQAAAITAMGALVMGAGVGLLTVAAQTLIQSETPLPLLGRVSSAVTSLISLAQILGLSLSGVAASTMGLRHSFLTAAALLALFCLVSTMFLSRDSVPKWGSPFGLRSGFQPLQATLSPSPVSPAVVMELTRVASSSEFRMARGEPPNAMQTRPAVVIQATSSSERSRELPQVSAEPHDPRDST